MKPCIMKFGGASVSHSENILAIAKRIQKRREVNDRIVLVVSAMGDTTNRLMQLARSVHPFPPTREQDMMISVGERVSIALLAMALERLGCEAKSFTGSQSGIITNEDHSDAKIVEVRPKRIVEALEAKKIVIVAGFQGVSRSGEITTLGRGGSDTTAVALAVALGASCVEFYKDVKGIYDQDPNSSSKAKLLSSLTFDEALSLCSLNGARVLHARSVELAKKHGIRLQIHSFIGAEDEAPGTIIGEESSRKLECIYE